MSELGTFVQLGFRHVVDVEAMDHILFLLALAAMYRLRDARSAVAVITAFTIAHSMTLALAVTKLVRLPSSLIEFVIPVTIIVTGLENLVASDERKRARRGWYRPFIAGVFGLIHGAGFANYLSELFVEHIAVPLVGFNIGIELGQVVVLAVAACLLAAMDSAITRLRLRSEAWPAYRVRVAAVSTIVVAVAALWAVERAPW
ncbi:MAG TPA: HupE/UreJ family protein [Gemmatimonadaceae bacterium]